MLSPAMAAAVRQLQAQPSSVPQPLAHSHQLSANAITSSGDIGNQALNAKNARVRAEQDLQLLQNRINRLVIEEERAAKRIAETRRRAKEIRDLKQRNKANQEAQSEAVQWMRSEQELQRQLLQQSRAERNHAIDASRTALKSMRKDEVSVLRQMRKENEEAVAAQRNLEHARVVARKQLVQEQQRAAQIRKAQERQRQLQKLREERERQQAEIDEDAQMTMQRYAEMVEMEKRLTEELERKKYEQVSSAATRHTCSNDLAFRSFSREDN
uniref:Uncharacterized protein n=1 Tax=Chrysotila carterae TaxID=13221 RepID=A0A7S4ES94_CHRCT